MYGDELSGRKKAILKAVVESYIENGDPVGSKSLQQLPGMKCSSATIRNEMAELEDMGYLEQPHTSAGRVPSQLGYRFYVDQLIEHYAMTTGEIAQINQVLKSKTSEVDQILLTASRLASTMTNYTGIAAKPKCAANSAMPVALSTPRTLTSAKIGHQRDATSDGSSAITLFSSSGSK